MLAGQAIHQFAYGSGTMLRSGNRRVLLRLESSDQGLLDSAIGRMVQVLIDAGAKVLGPIPLPTRVQCYKVLRRSEWMEYRVYTHKRILTIVDPDSTVLKQASVLDLPPGIDVAIQDYSKPAQVEDRKSRVAPIIEEAKAEEPMSVLVANLDMREVLAHYLERERIHTALRERFANRQVVQYVELALGIEHPAGNYSANEHQLRLGPRILAENRPQHVFDLATAIEACPNTHHLPELIYNRGLKYLKISVGSEIAMMLKPGVYWVGNRRTIWSHLLIKHNWQLSRANEELELYLDGERDSEMDYAIWRDIYLALEQNVLTLARLANEVAASQGVTPGTIKFMWPDAVASCLYERFAKSG